MKDYRNIFPFKIGTSSFVLHVKKDNIIRNIEFLKDSFDKIQLLLFGKDYLDDFFNPSVLNNLIRIKNENLIKYSIHLPIDLYLLNSSKIKRERALDVVFKIIEKTKVLDVKEYILHIDGNGEKVELNKSNFELFEDVCKKIKSKVSNTDSIIIENTSYDLTFFKNIIYKYNYSVCLDIGHLIICDLDIGKFIDEFKSKIKVIHIHGVKNNKDHKPLNDLDKNVLKIIINYLKSYDNSVIIEVFNKSYLIKSIKFLKKYFKEGSEWN